MERLMFGGGGAGSPPPPPKVDTTALEQQQSEAEAQQRQLRRRRAGRQSTRLTDPIVDLSNSQPNQTRVSLLGGGEYASGR